MTRVRLYKREFGLHVLQSEGMQRAMGHFAAPIKARAEAIAPVDSGRYKRSFSVEIAVRDVAERTPPYRSRRAVARVVNSSPHALHVEFGTQGGRAGRTGRGTPRFRVLGRALDAAEGR